MATLAGADMEETTRAHICRAISQIEPKANGSIIALAAKLWPAQGLRAVRVLPRAFPLRLVFATALLLPFSASPLLRG